MVRQLGKIGLDEPRMGIAGYSKFQPVAANIDDSARQQNRRVEIYILARTLRWPVGMGLR